VSDRFYIDCEFDGHGGPLLSIAVIHEDGASMYLRTDAVALDPWVIENVVPHIVCPGAPTPSRVPVAHHIGGLLRGFIGGAGSPVIIADSPVDIGRFCAAVSTSYEGNWTWVNNPLMTFEAHNIDIYPTDLPGAVRHNAWWDAMALREKLRAGD